MSFSENCAVRFNVQCAVKRHNAQNSYCISRQIDTKLTQQPTPSRPTVAAARRASLSGCKERHANKNSLLSRKGRGRVRTRSHPARFAPHLGYMVLCGHKRLRRIVGQRGVAHVRPGATLPEIGTGQLGRRFAEIWLGLYSPGPKYRTTGPKIAPTGSLNSKSNSPPHMWLDRCCARFLAPLGTLWPPLWRSHSYAATSYRDQSRPR